MMRVRAFRPSDQSALIALWERCDLVRPWNDPAKDIARKLAVDPDLFLVGLIGTEIVASAMAGYDGHRGWVNYLAVDPSVRRAGLGRCMMGDVERLLRDRGCPKINLQIRGANAEAIEFYRALGYAVDDVISMGKRLEQDG